MTILREVPSRKQCRVQEKFHLEPFEELFPLMKWLTKLLTWMNLLENDFPRHITLQGWHLKKIMDMRDIMQKKSIRKIHAFDLASNMPYLR